MQGNKHRQLQGRALHEARGSYKVKPNTRQGALTRKIPTEGKGKLQGGALHMAKGSYKECPTVTQSRRGSGKVEPLPLAWSKALPCLFSCWCLYGSCGSLMDVYRKSSTTLHCYVVHCTILHSTALCCTALHCYVLHCTALHSTAVCSTALHCIAN